VLVKHRYCDPLGRVDALRLPCLEVSACRGQWVFSPYTAPVTWSDVHSVCGRPHLALVDSRQLPPSVVAVVGVSLGDICSRSLRNLLVRWRCGCVGVCC